MFLVPFLSDNSLGKILWDGCWNTWLKCVVIIVLLNLFIFTVAVPTNKELAGLFRGEKQGLISTRPFVQDIFLAEERNCPGFF